MIQSVLSWCESVAFSVFQTEATPNGAAVMYEMCAALIGDDAATTIFERAARLSDEYRGLK